MMNRKSYSMVKLLRLIYTSITLFLLSILLIFSLYSLKMVKEQFTAAQQQSLNLYMNELDQSLAGISSSLHMYQLREGSPDFSALGSGDLYRRKSDIISDFSASILFLNHCDGLFLFDAANDEYGYVFRNLSSSHQTYNTRLNIKNAVIDIMSSCGLSASSGWYLKELDNRQYLLYLQWIDDFCYGSWVSADSLLPDISAISPFEGSFAFLTDGRDTCLACDLDTDPFAESSRTSYITTCTVSAAAPLALYVSTPGTHSLAAMSVSLRILISISIFALLTIAIADTALKRIIKDPLKQVLAVIAQYESGNLDYTASTDGLPEEIIHINQALGSMSCEIRMLKIDIYEKQLLLKDIQLQYLQHQIKPHFIINILNTIGLMVQTHDIKKITETIACLSQYMRNTMNLTIQTATLRCEMEQLENYLHLQRIRYPDQITVSSSIAPELEELRLPVLTIQTLTENIFKHAMDPYLPLSIRIEAFIQKDLAILTVHDNGCGFPPALIGEFNSNPSAPGNGQHIGLVNIRQRLHLEYPDSSMVLSNDSGAVVTIALPASAYAPKETQP